MNAPARLLALRLQGFKSFAERTHVEFGSGISAVVGPNGSGKSNLADALRWALGEQGRALRTRRSEDVIFAGSERRAALGMADVALMLDNRDGLLPVEYETIELGRRLYRSGENDYLLNRQRIRLRGLVDLLDAAHLADNAFLFIGQGMVDQALALRPEERRPLFEEVAGVRRHERRRRRAEEQLVEAEGNLARVEDIIAELRPQARRLAAQAEQQATRHTAAEELADAVVRSAHARWHETAVRAREARTLRETVRGAADRELRDLSEAEERVSAIAVELAARSDVERDRRVAHERARAELTDLQLREARLATDLAALGRDRARLTADRAAAEAEVASQRRTVAVPVPERDLELEASLAEAERALAEAIAELGALRSASRARGEQLSAIRRAEAARQAELELAKRRVAEAARLAREATVSAAEATEQEATLQARRVEAAARLASTIERAVGATARTEDAQRAAAGREAEHRSAVERASALGERLAAMRGRVDTLREHLASEEARGIARAARREGGRRLDVELQVDPALRAAVEAALGELARAYLVPGAAVPRLAAERGTVVVEEQLVTAPPSSAAMRALVDRAVELGGGPLVDAIRRDPTGAVRPVLTRAVWVPDLDAIAAIQSQLPAGAVAVTRDGGASATDLSVTLGRPDPLLERRAELARLEADIAALERDATGAASRADDAATALAGARDALAQARAEEAAASGERRRDEERDRVAARDLEGQARETAWRAAQVERLTEEVRRAGAALAALESAEHGRAADAPVVDGDESAAIAVWERRGAELRTRRDRVAADASTADAARRAAEAQRARAEAAVSMAGDRLARADRELAALDEAELRVRTELETLGTILRDATEGEARGREALEALLSADAVDRGRLADAEAAAAGARDRLRLAEERFRSADVADLEARLALDAIREGVLVELAGLGEAGVRRLAMEVGATGPDDAGHGARGEAIGPDALDDEAAALERLLAAVAVQWDRAAPSAEAPTPGRLATLRRRYHELGAANPFAVDEYAALRDRLGELERQESDLREAITSTRSLIDELSQLVAEQFRTTFRALEAAFDRRFQQLFGGGFARLSLTDPSDLAATGVEIVARPPGKKAQNLAMLSGGERALTAVALLFAMLEVRPVPFCVLDEVDAALDEANVGRFTDALRGLSEHIQFIVITHNRGTIEMADALYGVTVGDDSVSRVISLRLEEAQAIAERSTLEPVPAT